MGNGGELASWGDGELGWRDIRNRAVPLTSQKWFGMMTRYPLRRIGQRVLLIIVIVYTHLTITESACPLVGACLISLSAARSMELA